MFCVTLPAQRDATYIECKHFYSKCNTTSITIYISNSFKQSCSLSSQSVVMCLMSSSISTDVKGKVLFPKMTNPKLVDTQALYNDHFLIRLRSVGNFGPSVFIYLFIFVMSMATNLSCTQEVGGGTGAALETLSTDVFVDWNRSLVSQNLQKSYM